MSLQQDVRASIKKYVVKKDSDRYRKGKEYGYDLEGELMSDEGGEKLVLQEMNVARIDSKGNITVIVDELLAYSFQQVMDEIEKWRDERSLEKLGKLGT